MRIRIYYFIIWLINSFPLASLLAIIRPLIKNIFIDRSYLKVEETGRLSKNIPLGVFILTTPELHKSNDWYGNATVFKKYAGIDKNYQLKVVIEHGLFFGDYIWEQDKHSNLPLMLTFSKKRAAFLKGETKKETFAIGPYIHYATPYLNENQERLERKRLGKNLLIFPTHSTATLSVYYDTKKFIRKIKQIGKDFDSIRVCLYWKDILLGMDKIYREEGLECVTAGHIFDPLFTSRLKSIISLSTITMTNGIGTYSGYCIYIKKPHYYYEQNLDYKGNWGDWPMLDKESISKIEADLRVIQQAFGEYRNFISKSQYDIANLFWGFDQIKTPQQIKRIFQTAEKL